MKIPSFGFVGWNPFQLIHVRDVIKALPGSVFILESRKNYINEFDSHMLNDINVPVLVWESGKLNELDGVFDVIVCQTLFPKIEKIQKSKIAMIQYGYAKEPHNYGAWRSLSDLTMVYGPYAGGKIENFSPVEITGNPRYDQWYSEDFHKQANIEFGRGIDPSRKTVLYAPTWGDLSSVDMFLSAVYGLSQDYNVLVKMHHNTDLLEPARRKGINASSIANFGANDDLLRLISLADVVISDYSGAIFDAIYCEKPVVLLDLGEEILSKAKLDMHSIEYSRRAELGILVDHPAALKSQVDTAIRNQDMLIQQAKPLRDALFFDGPGSTERVCSALRKLVTGEIQREQKHEYIRKEILELLNLKVLNEIAKKKLAMAKPAAKKVVTPAAKKAVTPAAKKTATQAAKKLA